MRPPKIPKLSPARDRSLSLEGVSRLYLTGRPQKIILEVATRNPKYAAVLGGTFQPPGECVPHALGALMNALKDIQPQQKEIANLRRNSLPSVFRVRDESVLERQLNDRNLPIRELRRIYQPSVQVAIDAVKEYGIAVLRHYGIGEGYDPDTQHAVIMLDVLRIGSRLNGPDCAVICDYNDLMKNPAVERAQALVPPGGTLADLLPDILKKTNALEGMLRVAMLPQMFYNADRAFGDAMSNFIKFSRALDLHIAPNEPEILTPLVPAPELLTKPEDIEAIKRELDQHTSQIEGYSDK